MTSVWRSWASLSAGAVLLSGSLVAVAQPPGGFGGGPGGPGGPGGGFRAPMMNQGMMTNMLLMRDDVREELGLLDEQVEQLQGLQTNMRERMGDVFRQAREEAGDDREAMFSKVREVMEKQQEEIKADMDQILLPHQSERLGQLGRRMQMQFQGADQMLSQGELSEELGITEAQKVRLKEMNVEAQKVLKEKMIEAQKAAEEKLLSVLTSEQQSKYKELLGEPFDLTMRPGQGGPGGPGARGAGGPGGRGAGGPGGRGAGGPGGRGAGGNRGDF